jgi:O-antigen ligase
VVVGACAIAAVGVAESLLGRPLIHTDLPPHARPFGPFANRNHAASLLVLALPLALGFARDASRERRGRRSAKWIVAAALLSLALIVNGSRGGSLAALAVLAFACALARIDVAIKAALAGAVALALVLPGSAWERRGDSTTVGERVQLARDALGMAGDSPLFGVGLGAFGAAYPPYQRVEKDLRFRHVESEPIELLVEGGVPLAALAVAAFVLLVGIAARNFRRARSATSAALAASALAIPFHACCDFPLRVPGVVLPALLVIGSLLAVHDRDSCATLQAAGGAT